MVDTPKPKPNSNKKTLESARYQLQRWWREEDKRVLVAVGQAIRANRKAQRLTIAALAEKAGVNAAYLGEAERGRSNMSMKFLARICRAMNLALPDIVPKEQMKDIAFPVDTARHTTKRK